VKRVEALPDLLDRLDAAGRRFGSFVLSGNGEPCLEPADKLAAIVRAVVARRGLFDELRLQSNGTVFLRPELLRLFAAAGFVLKETILHPDPVEDQRLTKGPLIPTLARRGLPRILNRLLLRHDDAASIAALLSAALADPGIVRLNLSRPNTNTRDGSSGTPWADWVAAHGADAAVLDAAEALLRADPRLRPFAEDEERLCFVAAGGKPVVLYRRDGRYGGDDLVIYGGAFVDYALNPVDLAAGAATTPPPV